MEKSNKKNWLVIVLIVIVLGLVGFLVYDKFIADNNCPKVEEKECPKQEECKKEECNCNTTLPTNNSFAIYRDNLIKQIKESGLPIYKSVPFEYYDAHYRLLLNNKMELSLVKDPARDDATAKDINVLIKKDVIDCGVGISGSAAIPYIFFINSDGSLEMFDTYEYLENGTVKLNKFKKATNIVSINQGSLDSTGLSQEPFFIDINGKVYDNEFTGGWD